MPQHSNQTVLIVDDEPTMQRLFSSKFRKQVRNGTLNLLFASDGTEALQILAENPQTNIIFSDLNMPRMDGITLLQKLREQFRGHSIIITAYGDYERLRAAMNEGAFDFLSKPLNFQDLEITLSRAIEAQNRISVLEQKIQQMQLEIEDLKQRLEKLN